MFDRRLAAGFLAGILLLLVAACSAPPRPAGGSDSARRPAAALLTGSHRVVASDVMVKVYRDGPLAELGHNHVVATTAVTGWIDLREPLESSTFSLTMPLDSLVVDDAARRAAAGTDFPGELPAADKDGTRRNLLGPALLDAARYPLLHLDSIAIEPAEDGYQVLARTEVAGVERRLRLPARLERRDGQVVISGEFVLTHAELGLKPFSAALGALRVREDMEVAYRLVATGGRP